MKFLRNASALALLGLLAATAPASAYTMAQAAQPRERPPASFSGDLYVDSRGCAYARSVLGNVVNWIPRIAADRKSVICGLTPTFAAGRSVASAPPPPPPPPPPPELVAAPAMTATAAPATAPSAAPVRTARLFGNLPTPSPAPEPTRMPGPGERSAASSAASTATATASTGASRTLSVTCPADGSTARVRIGADTVAITCAPGATRPTTYMVRHSNGSTTRLVANPAPSAAPRATTLVAAAPSVGLVSGSPRVRIGGVPPGGASNNFGSGYGVLQGGVAPVAGALPAVTPRSYAPATVVAPRAPTAITITPPGNSFGNGYGLAPTPGAGRVYVPAGYRPAWSDDRLNPNRGPQTAYGDAQMAAVYDTSRLPMRELATPASALVVSSKSPAARAVAPAAAPAPVAASGYRYVQVGAFSVASNAEAAAARLKALGLPGKVARTASGRTVVVAGPYADASALRAALAAARQGGFADAFLRS